MRRLPFDGAELRQDRPSKFRLPGHAREHSMELEEMSLVLLDTSRRRKLPDGFLTERALSSALALSPWFTAPWVSVNSEKILWQSVNWCHRGMAVWRSNQSANHLLG